MEYIDYFSDELISGLLNVFQKQVVSIILYGSVAKGVATNESDIDIAVIIKGDISEAVDTMLSDFIVDMNLKYDKVFSVIDINDKEFKKWENISPFYRNVKEEGIVLWKAA